MAVGVPDGELPLEADSCRNGDEPSLGGEAALVCAIRDDGREGTCGGEKFETSDCCC